MADQILPRAKTFNTKLSDFSKAPEEKTGPYASDLEVDSLIVGAGFAGIFMLKTLRDRGYKAVIYEAGADIGGVWRWNCFPGARTDSEAMEYQFSWPEVWKTWNWRSNYPTYKDIRAYFDHVDKVVGVRKDCAFNTVVVGARFDTNLGRWVVRTADGRIAKAKYLILGTGPAARRYVPPWPGMDKFKGIIHHSAFWPDEGVDVKGKRCAVIGTGASGVQIAQAWGHIAGELKVFQRTPNLSLPMRERALTVAEQENAKGLYPILFRYREATVGGQLYNQYEKSTFDDTPEERQELYEKIWAEGGFRFWVCGYKDLFTNADANREAYQFWVRKTRDRIVDPRKRDLLAPLDMPHFFGIKRPSLEINYFEQFNRATVDIVDIQNNAIKEFDETGIILEDGTHYELDVIAIATGFHMITGGMMQLGLESIDKTKLEEEWKNGVETYLGITVGGYPNMFHMYGPHSPNLGSNGPTCVEVQGRWIADCIAKMERNGVKYINPKPGAVTAWKNHIVEGTGHTLFPTIRSIFMGGAIPEKVKEPVTYLYFLNNYIRELREALDTMDGFEKVTV
ncbi:hypothetical protein GGR51DRAFT_511445 [Nemania sp. FL0031]|nr:hypothetical protein GGR51DRAFT_511445 [Nemania sp. FL0031]